MKMKLGFEEWPRSCEGAVVAEATSALLFLHRVNVSQQYYAFASMLLYECLSSCENPVQSLLHGGTKAPA